MAMTITGFKRTCPMEEELLLLDPHHMKRCRLEALLPHSFEDDGVSLPDEVEEALASAVAAAASASASSSPVSGSGVASVAPGANCSRRRNHEDVEMDSEADAGPPSDKRLRHMGGRVADVNEVRPWAETTVRALHGCPSVDEAVLRCSRVLSDLCTEVRQAATREVQQAADAAAAAVCEARHEPEEETTFREMQRLQHTNKVLRRAVFHLAERCRKLDHGAQEAASLRQALEQSQEAQRRLQHSNEVLQGHLRVHLDSVCGAEPWTN